MDVPISSATKQRRQRRRWGWAAGAVAALALVLAGLWRLQPAAPGVEKSTLFVDTVKRGEMLCQVRGVGTLVPEEIRWVPTVNAGRVEQILVLPGARVTADMVLVELSNPDVDQARFDAQWQLKGAEAELANLRAQLSAEKLNQEKAVAMAEAEYSGAKMEYETEIELAGEKLAPAITLKQAKNKAGELAKVLEIQQKCLGASAESAQAQLEVQAAKVSQLRAQLELRQGEQAALKIRAGMDGVFQRWGDPANPLQPGQRLAAGAPVACIANTAKLKAAIKLPETEVRDVQLDQPAEIDTRNGTIPGHVTRIDPAVENGTVTVDVALDGPLPKGARPDLSVDGIVQLERLADVLHVGRPVQSRPDSTVRLFRLEEGGRTAVRVPVKLGRGSVSTMEILSGLQAGDQVILSDMSQWDGHERLRME